MVYRSCRTVPVVPTPLLRLPPRPNTNAPSLARYLQFRRSCRSATATSPRRIVGDADSEEEAVVRVQA